MVRRNCRRARVRERDSWRSHPQQCGLDHDRSGPAVLRSGNDLEQVRASLLTTGTFQICVIDTATTDRTDKMFLKYALADDADR